MHGLNELDDDELDDEDDAVLDDELDEATLDDDDDAVLDDELDEATLDDEDSEEQGVEPRTFAGDCCLGS